MISVGITGGIGSGKSMVCRMLGCLGVPSYEADSRLKNLYENDHELLDQIRNELSEDVFDGVALSRKKLATFIFGNQDRLQKINAIVKPFIVRDFTKWKSAQTSPYVLLEVAILFETGADSLCDKIITVTAPLEIRFARILSRDSRSREEIERIVVSQWDDQRKIDLSDFVIINDGRDLTEQIMNVHYELIR